MFKLSELFIYLECSLLCCVVRMSIYSKYCAALVCVNVRVRSIQRLADSKNEMC